jgi:hypothetical protein
MASANTPPRLSFVELIAVAAVGIGIGLAVLLSRRRQEDLDPLSHALNEAPIDDEPLTAADIEALAAAREDYSLGRVRDLADVNRELTTA